MDRRKVLGAVVLFVAVGLMLLPDEANAGRWGRGGCCWSSYDCCGYGYTVNYAPCGYVYSDCCNGSTYPATNGRTTPPAPSTGTGRTSYYYPESQGAGMARTPQAPTPAPSSPGVGLGGQVNGMGSGTTGQGAIGTQGTVGGQQGIGGQQGMGGQGTGLGTGGTGNLPAPGTDTQGTPGSGNVR